jgi:hypothetical protein
MTSYHVKHAGQVLMLNNSKKLRKAAAKAAKEAAK